MQITGLDHVQLAMPAGGEDTARQFYADLLGFSEVAKPNNLAKRGGCWFELGNVKLHLGVACDFLPATKAHPAFLVKNLSEALAKLTSNNVQITEDEPLTGYLRAYIKDPFGNRIELMQQL